MSPRHQPLNITYASYMRNHPFGTALYTPLSIKEFHPGICGYFDSNGSWNPIADLSDSTKLEKQGYSTVNEELERAPTDTDIQWGPLTSENVVAHNIDFSGGISSGLAAALPVNLSAELSFSNSTSGGALLLTAPPVVHERFYHESMFKNWVIENAAQLVKHRSEILEHGLCVVTNIWATEDCAIHVWDQAGKEIKIGFDVGVDAIGELGPGVGWSVNRKDGGWMRYKASKDDRLVVFFAGLRFRSRKIPIHREILKPITRKFEDFITVSKTITNVPIPGDNENIWAIDCEHMDPTMLDQRI
ncbi:hypothetical protein N7478_012129 [Penicillium angulare]|uniref:uncharacterized protein n=1 Tax=Penicillium angulare TaxID=116970 RepID=UPI002542088C|nr:uncharacterized protein N7478_012129 [Penicillium angulare]KAJ5260524.1 hypothetical protein N7478_012129 [Penicillium angulare]